MANQKTDPPHYEVQLAPEQRKQAQDTVRKEIGDIQERLWHLGFNVSKKDGWGSRKLKDAVTDFQKAIGWKPYDNYSYGGVPEMKTENALSAITQNFESKAVNDPKRVEAAKHYIEEVLKIKVDTLASRFHYRNGPLLIAEISPGVLGAAKALLSSAGEMRAVEGAGSQPLPGGLGGRTLG